MIVLVLTACPPGLRGYLTRWLLEISAGVFVGKVSKRVRELMWGRTVEMVRSTTNDAPPRRTGWSKAAQRRRR